MITCCPGTLAAGHKTYSKACLNRLFNGKRVSHILPYDDPASVFAENTVFLENQERFSISGVQEKFSFKLDKNKLRLVHAGEQGDYILKSAPGWVKNGDQMPANEHLTMQIARQVFDIETAENALVFFKTGQSAYLTKRFDVNPSSGKWAAEDFASIAGKTAHTHGTHYKYEGSYLLLFELMKKHLPVYQIDAPKVFKVLLFNYLFSNGDAHLKNFSILETPMGDFRFSPAYDLLNTGIHVDDSPFAMSEGLFPKAKGKVFEQFQTLALLAGIAEKQSNQIFQLLLSRTEQVKYLVDASFLSLRFKRNYFQAYQGRLNKLKR